MKQIAKQFSIAIVKPAKGVILRTSIKATDRAWRTAIFGMGGSKKRIGGAQIGTVDGQPIAVIAELWSEVEHGTPTWTILTDNGLYGFAGPGAVFNNAGFGPATLGITIDRLREVVTFNPDPESMAEGLRRTLESRGQADASE